MSPVVNLPSVGDYVGLYNSFRSVRVFSTEVRKAQVGAGITGLVRRNGLEDRRIGTYVVPAGTGVSIVRIYLAGWERPMPPPATRAATPCAA